VTQCDAGVRGAHMRDAWVSASEYWSQPVDSLLAAIQTSSDGLSTADASSRLSQYGPNVLEARETASAILAKGWLARHTAEPRGQEGLRW